MGENTCSEHTGMCERLARLEVQVAPIPEMDSKLDAMIKDQGDIKTAIEGIKGTSKGAADTFSRWISILALVATAAGLYVKVH